MGLNCNKKRVVGCGAPLSLALRFLLQHPLLSSANASGLVLASLSFLIGWHCVTDAPAVVVGGLELRVVLLLATAWRLDCRVASTLECCAQKGEW